jgi:hypothetical protein
MSAVKLSHQEILNLSSGYINEGLKKEKWAINAMTIDTSNVEVSLSMTETAYSTANNSNFHLSFLTAMEMIAQMMVIYLHYQANYEYKTREIWVSSISSKFIKPISDPNNIHIKMKTSKLWRKGENLICDASCEVTGPSGGLFKSQGRTWLI